MPNLNRRALVASLAASALGGGSVLDGGAALAAPRARYNDPDDDAGFYRGRGTGEDALYGRGPAVRDSFFEPPPEPEPDAFGFRNPFAPQPADPYGTRRGATAPSVFGDGGADYRRVYGPVGGEPFPIPAFDYRRLNPAFLRQTVIYPGREEPGSIVVDPRARHLYFVMGGGRAMRYGVGVGRQGFAWSGVATVNSKQEWPDWYPPKEMIQRQPALARSLAELRSGIGMAGGSRNPLGARAMYLWQGNRDTLYRIHGTVEPWTIGSSVSSGCIRMVNQDAIDLYNRVQVGARVSVLG